jgi:opacity protein-like surface antigen
MCYKVKKRLEKNSLEQCARSGLWVVALLVGLSLVFPSEAYADGWVSGFIGRAFGGSSGGGGLSEALKSRDTATYGFNIGGMSGGVLGAEFDFGYTPNFFGSDSGVRKSGVMTIMGSLIAGVPVGGQSGAGIRPYGFFGLGLLRRNIEFSEALDDISSNDFGYNVGGGIMGFFTNVFGVRGEYRYFRRFKSDDLGRKFNFSRATIGIVLRF